MPTVPVALAAAMELPLADGGLGTVAVLHAVVGGHVHDHTVTGPLGDPTPGSFLLLDDGRAVVDTATTSGLGLISANRHIAEHTLHRQAAHFSPADLAP